MDMLHNQDAYKPVVFCQARLWCFISLVSFYGNLTVKATMKASKVDRASNQEDNKQLVVIQCTRVQCSSVKEEHFS